MTYVVLGLGSNTYYGHLSSVELLANACTQLADILEDMKISSLYKSAPMYYLEQKEFFNMAVSGFYNKDAFSLLEEIHSIEAMWGRDRSKEIRNGPRPLDIDIELFGKEKISSPRLTVPHERLTERAFVLAPLLELLPQNADVTVGSSDFYKKKLEAAVQNRQQIEKIMDSKEFCALLNCVSDGNIENAYGG